MRVGLARCTQGEMVPISQEAELPSRPVLTWANYLTSRGFYPHTIKSVPSRHIDYAIQAHLIVSKIYLYYTVI